MTVIGTAIADRAPGAAIRILKEAIGRVQKEVNDARLKRTIEEVARKFETDPTIAQERIAQALQEEWGYRLIEHYFSDLMHSTHTTAEVAIAAMMAEYLYSCRAPDREYQLVGGLLRSSDEELLRGIYAVTGRLLDVARRADEDTGNPSTQARDEYIIRVGDSHFWVVRRTPQGNEHISSGAPVPSNLDLVFRVMDRHEFGKPNIPETSASGHFDVDGKAVGGTNRYLLTGNDEPRARRLHAYLAVALDAPQKWGTNSDVTTL